MSIWKVLNEPFPDESNPQKLLLTAFAVSLFVTFFLYLFQPFGLNNFGEGKFFVCIGFGLVTFICAIIFEFFSTYIFRIEKDLPTWTFFKWILEAVASVLFIACGNYLFAGYFYEWTDWSISSFLYMIRATLMVGIFPIVFSGLWSQIKAKKRNIGVANAIQPETLKISNTPTPLIISSKNNKQTIELFANQFYFAEAMQNYVTLYYHQNEGIKKELIRNTIGNIEQSFLETNIIRCHRSYLVNIDQVERIDGNAQGLRLTLKDLDEVIVPVSRKYIKELKQRFK